MQTCSLCQLLHVVTPGTGVRPGKQQKGMLVVHREQSLWLPPAKAVLHQSPFSRRCAAVVEIVLNENIL